MGTTGYRDIRVTLHHTLVEPPSHGPERWALWLHGIFGSGQNFRSLARALVADAPEWGACLVDLRGHGQSRAMAAPHTLDAIAGDLVELEADLPGPVEGVVGHSFGGKVALAYAARRERPLSHAVILDATPSARPDGLDTEVAGEVLSMLERIEEPMESREQFLEIVRGHGYSPEIAQWLAMNVRRAPDGFRLRIDLSAIRSMLADYFERDLWSVLEGARSTERWMVIGGRSPVIGPRDRERLHALAASDPTLHVELLERAGHWVHAEDPAGTLAVLRRVFDASHERV
jgi:esterase